MKHSILILLLAASTAAASAQTASTPASTPGTSATPAAKTATTAKPAAKAATAAKPAATAAKPAGSASKLPAGVPPPPPGTVTKSVPFALRYQDLKIGPGAEADPSKLYKVHYTLYLGANGLDSDGKKLESSHDHPGQPLKDKDGKPILGDDGKPKVGDPQPISFSPGSGRTIPGFELGFDGMKVGGQRRIFIPWQLAYGAKGRPGPNPANPGIPPKANLIFDVELVDLTDMPAQPSRPGMPPSGARPPAPGTPGGPPATPKPAAPASPATPGTSATPAKPAAPAAPATPPPATTTAPAQPK